MKSTFIEFANKIPKNQVNPSEDDLYNWTKPKIITNVHGLPLFKSNITSRSAAFTDLVDDDNRSKLEVETEDVIKELNPDEFVLMKLKLGESKDVLLRATYAIPKKYAHKALMMSRNFFRSDHKIEESDIYSLDVPFLNTRHVIVDPDERISYIFGIDYYGEAKMSLLRMGMEIMRRDKNGLGLHAGSKTFRLLNNKGEVEEKGALIFGLSGTGKTTLTCHNHGMKSPEGVTILQDDINFILPNGQSYGTEKGFYVKCDNCPEHKEITHAVLEKNSILENVALNKNRDFDWKNFEHTANTRAIIKRADLVGTGNFIDLPNLNYILYNTRRPELPPIGRLTTPEQAAAYYGLGESIITSAEDPNKAGQSKRVVGFDPFIMGEYSLNINRMKEIIKNKNGIDCYVVNTGYVGDESNNITVGVTLACIEQAIRGKVEWQFDEDLGYEVPKTINGIEWNKFNPRKYYGDAKYKELMKNLRNERKSYLSKFNGILPEIISSL